MSKYYIFLIIYAGQGPNWKSALKYTIPNLIFGVIYNSPKFFEFNMHESVEIDYHTNMTFVKTKFYPTKLRLNDDYVYYYVNWSRFLVSGLVPLVSLGLLNFFIYRYVKYILTD